MRRGLGGRSRCGSRRHIQGAGPLLRAAGAAAATYVGPHTVSIRAWCPCTYIPAQLALRIPCGQQTLLPAVGSAALTDVLNCLVGMSAWCSQQESAVPSQDVPDLASASPTFVLKAQRS